MDLRLVRAASRDAALVGGTTLPDPYTDDEGLAFIERQWNRAERDEGLSLAIEDMDPARAVGATSLMLRRAEVADLGYWLVRDARGRGFGRETVELLVPWVLREMGVDAIEAFVRPANYASQRILDGCGFFMIGLRRHELGRISEELLVYRRDR